MPTLGSDPEFFFARKRLAAGKIGTIIGAEKVLPKGGIVVSGGKVIIDGVQAELNPRADTCRQRDANAIADLFQAIKQRIGKQRITINWSPTVKITTRELKSLSKESRMFGCDPSYNAYGESIEKPNPEEYKFRSAGGHIHIGKNDSYINDLLIIKGEYIKTVKILDIIAANTCVLIDRDPGNIERRKVYGRAGEYRKPPHGLEYRVLSNFWLKNYRMMSFAFGLVRMAMGIASDPEMAEMTLKAVNEDDIRNAINNNDYDLAKSNFDKVKHIFEMGQNGQTLTAKTLPAFDYFIKMGGLKCFKADPLKHWTSPGWSALHAQGWENYLSNIQYALENGQEPQVS